MHTLTGQHLIGGKEVGCVQDGFQAFDPCENLSIEPTFCEADHEIVDRAVRLAERDFDAYRKLETTERSHFLEAIGTELQSLKSPLIDRASQETGLPTSRLGAELGRTISQLKLFAQQLQSGRFSQIVIDQAQPDRTPAPKPDIRKTHVALGPVAVFGASNFPIAFSVAGGDTVSALAAGCPVVVKAHPAHPGTSELAGQAVNRAVKKCRLPEGIFSLVQGRSHQIGKALTQHPLIKAIAFTGSLAGGRSLFDLAAARPEPIPVYAEMGSVNPVFVLPRILQEKYEELASRFAESVTMGVGQFCTNPGLLIAQQGAGLEAFSQAVGKRLSEQLPAPMLHPTIKKNFLLGLERLSSVDGVLPVSQFSQKATADCLVSPVLLKTTAAVFLRHRQLSNEVFGPSSLIVACDSFAEMLAVAQYLQGQLTATVHATVDEFTACNELYTILERKAGRLLLNDFPTGVEVCPAMNHGGPYPATTDSRSTSVGAAAIERFLRPVCYQNFSRELLPDELKD